MGCSRVHVGYLLTSSVIIMEYCTVYDRVVCDADERLYRGGLESVRTPFALLLVHV